MRRRQASDGGFTLIEVVAAMGIAMFVLSALLMASISAVKASVSARVDQQAGDLLTKTLEDTRSLDFGAIAMSSADIVSDPTISGTVGSTSTPPVWTVPNGVGPENVVYANTGSITPHITTITVNSNNIEYTLKRYVTQVPGDVSRRVTVIVEWNVNNQPRSRTASTVIVESRRGLPLPNYVVSTGGAGVTAVNPGGIIQIPFIIKNLGARDSLELRAIVDSLPMNGWVFYPDATCAGGLTPGEFPTALPMSGGVYVTGELYPDSTSCYVATYTTTTATSFGVVIQATSTKQPSAESAVMVLSTVMVTVADGVVSATPTPTSTDTATPTPDPSTTITCATPNPALAAPSGFTMHGFTLLNSPAGDTTTIPVNPMERDGCVVQSTSHAYSTNINSDTGRLVVAGGNTNTGGGATVAEWRWLAPTITQIQGPAAVKFNYKCSGLSSTAQIALGSWNQTASSGQWTSQVSVTDTLSCTGGWATKQVALTAPNFSLRSKNGSGAVPIYLSLRFAVTSGVDVRLNYDEPSAPSTLFVGTNP